MTMDEVTIGPPIEDKHNIGMMRLDSKPHPDEKDSNLMEDNEVIIEPQIEVEEDAGLMQLDIKPLNNEKYPSSMEENDVIKGELDLVVSEGEAILEPCEGMEFESEEAAREFYGAYARNVGFRIRISRYTRSRRDNSIISRLFVCSKEGFRELRGSDGGKQQRQRAVTRVGCKAMLMVKKLADGKWVVCKFVKEHNHGPVAPRNLEVRVVQKEEDSVEEPNVLPDGGAVHEPYEGMEFDSEDDAREFYVNYARQMGFRARISKYCRSRRDNSIISRQIVCSKEGFRESRIKKVEANDGRVKRPRVVTRIGCKAMIIVKKLNTGKWVVSKFVKEHNHVLLNLKKAPHLVQSSNESIVKELVPCMKGDDVLPNAGMVDSSDSCHGSQSSLQESLTVLYNQLCYEAIKYAQEGAVSEEIYNVAMSALREAAEKVAAAKRSAGIVAQGVNGGHGSIVTRASSEAKNAVSGNEPLLMQPPVEFVLIPSNSFANDSKPGNHSVESPVMLNLPHGQGIKIPTTISVSNQSSPTANSVKVLVRHDVAEHMNAAHAQKLDNVGISKVKTTAGDGSNLTSTGFSEQQMLAFHALPVTVYMPVMGSLSESSSGTVANNTYTLVTAPTDASPVTTGTQSHDSALTPAKEQSRTSYTGPNPQVHATAIAAGARVIPPEEAASLIKAMEARVRTSKSAFASGCKKLSTGGIQSPSLCNSLEAGLKVLEQASSEEMKLHESGEGIKETEMTIMDSACEDHLFSDAGS